MEFAGDWHIELAVSDLTKVHRILCRPSAGSFCHQLCIKFRKNPSLWSTLALSLDRVCGLISALICTVSYRLLKVTLIDPSILFKLQAASNYEEFLQLMSLLRMKLMKCRLINLLYSRKICIFLLRSNTKNIMFILRILIMNNWSIHNLQQKVQPISLALRILRES